MRGAGTPATYMDASLLVGACSLRVIDEVIKEVRVVNSAEVDLACVKVPGGLALWGCSSQSPYDAGKEGKVGK